MIRINGNGYTIKGASQAFPALSRNFLKKVDRSREWTLAELLALNERKRAEGRKHACSPASRKSITGIARWEIRRRD
jgi:hypothetical protein